MLTIALCLVIFATWIVCVRRYGLYSIVSAGVAGLNIYSIPAIIGYVYPYHIGTSSLLTELAPMADATVVLTITAWLSLLATLSIPKIRLGHISNRSVVRLKYDQLALKVLVTLCLAGVLYLMISDGILFFIEERDEQTQSNVRLLWRWTPVIGLMMALSLKRRMETNLFLATILIIFISGDRTIIAIAAMAALVHSSKTVRLSSTKHKIESIIILAFGVVLVIAGKPIYLFAKSGQTEILHYAISMEGAYQLLKGFEPFIIANTLDLVVTNNFSMPIFGLMQGILGQLLLQPSQFGIDANSFNTSFSNVFATDLTYGIAGSLLGHAYAVGGDAFVVLISVLYGLTLRISEAFYSRSAGIIQILILIIGALISVYAHRNGIDNIFSFIRQIVIVVLVAISLSQLIGRGLSLGKC